MTSDHYDRDTRYPSQRTGTKREYPPSNGKNDSNCIVNRRHSLAHSNFRKAIYRSLSLPDGDHESTPSVVRYIQHSIKFLVACLLIVLIGSLIRFLRPVHKS